MKQSNKVYMLQCRLDTDLDNRMSYIPEHINLQGITVEAELYISVKVIREFRTVGNKLNEPVTYVIAKGGRATFFALNLNEGKEMYFQLDSKFIITDFSFGCDNLQTLKREIADWDWEGPGHGISTGEGIRPKDWCKPGSPGALMWRNILTTRSLTNFSKIHLKSRRFGFATVVLPEQYKSIITTEK